MSFFSELGISDIITLLFFFLNKGVKEFEARWIGWAGVNVPDEIGQKALTVALAEKVLKFLGALNCFFKNSLLIKLIFKN